MMIKRLDKTVSLENAMEESFEILKMVRPDWNRDSIKHKVFDAGITNKMFSFHLKGKAEDTVLIRINGNGTEEFLDRKAEVESFHLLSKHKCAPELYCVFNNGLCYQFIPGSTLTTETVCCPTVSKLIIKEMVKMHSIPKSKEQIKSTIPSLFGTMKRFLRLLRESGKSEVSWSLSKLESEINEMEWHLSKLDSPVVFCHNDLLIHNIVHDKDKDKVSFIDYEYAAFNYQAYDIANHFCEYAGLEPDFNLYPSKEYQLDWLKHYLLEHKKLQPESKEDSDDVDKAVPVLYHQVNHFSMAAHLLWGLWALVQSQYSDIDFDYNEYGNVRLREYFKRKTELLSN